MKLRAVFIGLLLLMTVAEAQESGARPSGTIYGTAYDSDGHPASQIKLAALPVGVGLGAPLPATRTNEKGEYRFTGLPRWGRYTVYGEDEEAGYSAFSTGSSGQTQPEEVDITPAHREGELTVHLPPKAGFLRINLTNRTGAAVPSMRIVVMRPTNPPALAFSSSCSSTQPILLPPDNELLLHIVSDGFQEWHDSVGSGKAVRIASGERLTLDVQLEPSN